MERVKEENEERERESERVEAEMREKNIIVYLRQNTWSENTKKVFSKMCIAQ
jgi:hypothetical protein